MEHSLDMPKKTEVKEIASFEEGSNKWVAILRRGDMFVRLGAFDTEEEAKMIIEKDKHKYIEALSVIPDYRQPVGNQPPAPY